MGIRQYAHVGLRDPINAFLQVILIDFSYLKPFRMGLTTYYIIHIFELYYAIGIYS